MRYFAMLALALTWAIAPAAEAGGKAKPADAAQQDAYAHPVMEITNVPEFDTFFDGAKAPIVSVIEARRKVDAAQKDLAVSLGLADTATLKEASDHLHNKAERKIKVLMNGKMPRLEASEAVDPEIQKGIDAFNKAFDQMEGALGELEAVQPELAALATKSGEIVASAPDKIKSAGVPAPKVPASLGATKKNAGTISKANDEVGKLTGSLRAMAKDVEATFSS